MPATNDLKLRYLHFSRLLRGIQEIRTIKEILCNREMSTTMSCVDYMHNRGPLGVRSPAEIVELYEQVDLGPENHGQSYGGNSESL
jgi:hypothetical protein